MYNPLLPFRAAIKSFHVAYFGCCKSQGRGEEKCIIAEKYDNDKIGAPYSYAVFFPKLSPDFLRESRQSLWHQAIVDDSIDFAGSLLTRVIALLFYLDSPGCFK